MSKEESEYLDARISVDELLAQRELPGLLEKFNSELLPLAKRLSLVDERADVAGLSRDFVKSARSDYAGYDRGPKGYALFRRP